MEETGKRFRETVLALGGGKAPLEVRPIKFAFLFDIFSAFFLINCGSILKNLMSCAGICGIPRA